MLTVDELKLKYLATTESGPAMTETDIVSENTFKFVVYSTRLRHKYDF